MYSTPYRQRITRADGRVINVVQKRAHLSFCFTGCCCGRVDRGYPPVPADAFKKEWIDRRLRNLVHLTKAGCLGPCALANVVCLVFDGRSVWFHSISHDWQVRAIFDYIEAMLAADRFAPPPAELAAFAFNYYDWDVRPHTDEAPPAQIVNPGLIALLTHADTDLLALSHARASLPPGLDVVGVSLMSIPDESVMRVWCDGKLSEAAAILMRVHGQPDRVPGFGLLQQLCRERGQRLAVVSGTGEMHPQMAQASDVPLEILQPLTSYLFHGGIANSRMQLSGTGSARPSPIVPWRESSSTGRIC